MWKKLLFTALTSVASATGRGLAKVAPGAYDKMRGWWSGKTIAIIGPTASGKNSMFDRLRKEEPPVEHVQTKGTTKIKNFDFSWPLPDKSKIDFHCKGSINVGGEIDERERNWIISCENADVIFYLLDISKLIERPDETIDRLKEDFWWMASNIRHFKSSAAIHILLNKIDLYVENVPVEQMVEHIDNALSDKLEQVENLAKKIFGVHFERITGVDPISMRDQYLFSLYFTEALKSIFTAKQK